jgi:transposase
MLIIEKKQTITPETEGVFLTREEFDEIQKKDAEKETKINNLEINVQSFQHELDTLKRMIFGQKSERYISNSQPPEQLQLPFATEIRPVEKPDEETLTYTRKKRKKERPEGHGRQILPDHLPRKVTVIEPDIDLTNAIKIGEKVSEYLGYKPGELYVDQIIRPQYKFLETEKIVIAELPPLPIPKGNAGASLLAYIIVSKYVYHLPFYRIAQILNRDSGDYRITESTLIDWFNAACKLLEPLYGDMKKLVISCYYLMADESPIKVLTKDKPGATHKGYFWGYFAPRGNLVLFEYQKGRGREGPKEFLKDFRGTLQTDGYTVYDYFENREGITLLSCMAHARRKFEESLDNDPELADWMMTRIQQLYEVEKKASLLNLSYDERKKLRQQESVPVLKEMEDWMIENQPKTLPASSIRKAMNYTLNLWKRLNRYVDDGRVEIDNNLIENSIRPIALGRKNYLFAGSHEAAQRAAMIYSFMGTCKKNGIDPQDWLTDVLSRINGCKVNQLEELLPLSKLQSGISEEQD